MTPTQELEHLSKDFTICFLGLHQNLVYSCSDLRNKTSSQLPAGALVSTTSSVNSSSTSTSSQQHKFRWNKQSSPVPNNESAPSLWQVQTPVGRGDYLVWWVRIMGFG